MTHLFNQGPLSNLAKQLPLCIKSVTYSWKKKAITKTQTSKKSGHFYGMQLFSLNTPTKENVCSTSAHAFCYNLIFYLLGKMKLRYHDRCINRYSIDSRLTCRSTVDPESTDVLVKLPLMSSDVSTAIISVGYQSTTGGISVNYQLIL